ncbi:SDR family oxidoreductase [Castellaniella sp. GW247-6E4]|uniref:NAD-dependent epimerase/dehydratase family protein n=1 Tax=Castellaniella sp. GW247-6E4 TaxID=3140380 RepID=UPI0033164165
MKVLLTGGGGFIGAWIARRLAARGMALRILDLRARRETIDLVCGPAVADAAEWVEADVADTAAVRAAARGCDALIHLAGMLTPCCRADPVLGAKVNLIGLLNAFLAARSEGIDRVLYMSSAGVFGPDGGEAPRPTTHYGAFKLAGERCAAAFWEDDRIPSIGFRPYVVYGLGREDGLSAGPSLACRAAARGLPYTIPFTGEFDVIHADDVAAAFEIALAAPVSQAHHIDLLGERARAEDVIEAIRGAVPQAAITAKGPPMPIRLPGYPTGPQGLLAGWSPRPLALGVAQTIDAYRRVDDAR